MARDSVFLMVGFWMVVASPAANLTYFPSSNVSPAGQALRLIAMQAYAQSSGSLGAQRQFSSILPYSSQDHTLSQTCYQVTNFSENNTAMLQIYNNTFEISVASMSEAGAVILINGNTLDMELNRTQLFAGGYYVDLTKVSYLPDAHTMTLLVCGSQTFKPQVTVSTASTSTTTVQTTTAAPSNSSAEGSQAASAPLVVPAMAGVAAAIIVGYMATRRGKAKEE